MWTRILVALLMGAVGCAGPTPTPAPRSRTPTTTQRPGPRAQNRPRARTQARRAPPPVRARKAPTTYINPAYKGRLALHGHGRIVRVKKGSDKLLILPLDFHGFPAKLKLLLEVTLYASFLATWGPYGVGLHPLRRAFDKAGFGNLLWQLAHGAYHLARRHRSPHLSKDRCRPWMVKLPGSLRKFLRWTVGALKAAGVPIPSGYRFRYLLQAHVDKLGLVDEGQAIKYRVTAAIVDVPSGTLVAATWFEQTTQTNKRAMVGDLGRLGSRLFKAFGPVLSAPTP